MLKILSLLILFVCLIEAKKLKLSNGFIEGKEVQGVGQSLYMFKKLPYAQAPVGQLRFRKPQPPFTWNGTLDATEYGPSCMISITRSGQNVTYSEDCLHANVFTSEKCLTTKNCPVLVLIHGGTYAFGNAVQYNDTQILQKYAQNDIIFVLPAYRVGFFGYIDLGEDYEDAPYNIGVYDIIAGLEWTKREIPAFGGDSNKITVYGYSAGAANLQYIISSPKYQDYKPFNQIILSSGPPLIKPGLGRNITLKMLNATGCLYFKNPNTNTPSPIKNQLECLRSLSAEKVIEVTGLFEKEWLHWGPQSNKDLFPAKNYGQLAKKRKPFPMIALTSVLEMGALWDPEQTVEHMCEEKLRIFGYEQKATIQACVDHYKNDSNVDIIVRDSYHAMTVQECMINVWAAKTYPNNKNPCWVGIFAQPNHNQHVNEIFYLNGNHFDNFDFTLNDALMDNFYPRTIRNFVRNGEPLDDWPTANEKGQNYYWFSFNVSSPNESKHEFPHAVHNKIFSQETVEFFLKYLRDVEKNATLKLSGNLNKIDANLLSLNDDNFEESDLVGKKQNSIYTSTLLILLLIVAIIFIVAFKVERRRSKNLHFIDPFRSNSMKKIPHSSYQTI